MENGQLVIWTGSARTSNKVCTGDIAVSLKGDRFLALYGIGISRGEIFYESDKEFRELTFEEERELFFKMK